MAGTHTIRRRYVAPLAVVTALVAAGCGKTGPSPVAQGFDSVTMAAGDFPITNYSFGGNVVFTPATPVYTSIVDFPQPFGEKAPLPSGHVHPPGFVVGLSGITQVDLDDGTHVTINAGHAIFAGPFGHHFHENPGPGPDDWLFLGPRTEAVRGTVPSPSAHEVFDSPTLPPLVAGATYKLRLEMFTIRPGGRSASVKQGGATLIYELDGANSLHQLNQPTQELGFGHAAFLPTGTIYQLRNSSKTSQSEMLVMTFWADNQAASTLVDNSLP